MIKPMQYPFDSAYILQNKRALKKSLVQKSSLVDKKIALVCGSTLGDVTKILELFLLDGGIRPTFFEGGYALFYENLVFDDGSLAEFAPDVLYVHTSNRNIRLWPTPQDTAETVKEKLDAEFAYFENMWQAAMRLGCPIVQNNFELPTWRNFGNLDAADVRGRVRYVHSLNARMAEYATANPGFYIHDLNYLSSMHGVDKWCDASTWYAYKYACAPAFIPELAHSVASLIKSLFGRTQKSVILDLDNTLWGGIIGEEGAEGVSLGNETPTGMVYSEFQSYLQMLSQRGILLNVASKNEESIATTGFEREDSVLKRDDFICFEANWEPKSRNMAGIAASLNIGADSFVFMDDNPAERELVRMELPDVVVPELTSPEISIPLIDRGGYFEVSAVSSDDAARGEMYKKNAERIQLAATFGDYDDYLKSLAMTAVIQPFSATQLERITQLINKTNQFNMTTRRYTLAQTTAIMESPLHISLCGKLVDKFGDNGLISVIIGSISGDVLDIDLWIMSCRVFKRHMEYAMFDALVRLAGQHGVRCIRGSWLSTSKNLLVKEFYGTIGFALTEETNDARHYEYEVPQQYVNRNEVIAVN